MAIGRYTKPSISRKLSESSQRYRLDEIRLGKRMENHRVRLANFITDNDYLWQFTTDFVSSSRWRDWRDINRDEFGYLPRLILYKDNEENKVALFFANLEKSIEKNLNKDKKDKINTLLSHIFDTRNELAMSSKFFVPHVLKLRGFCGREYQTIYDDLLQEGNIALMNAAHVFDYKMGYKFVTIARSYIDQAVDRALMDAKGPIHIPVGLHEKISRLEKLIEQSRDDNGGSLRKISKRLGMSFEEAVGLLNIAKLKATISLSNRQSYHDGEEGGELIDRIPDNNSIDLVEEIALREKTSPLIEKIKDIFGERVYDILIRRMNNETLKSIGESYGISRERIRQIERESKNYLIKKFT